MSDHRIDISAWSHPASSDQAVTARRRQIERAPTDLFATRPPQVPRFRPSARRPEELALRRARICLRFHLERPRAHGIDR